MGCVFPDPSHIVRNLKKKKKPTYLTYFPWVGERKHTINFLGQLIHVLQCKFSEWLCLQIAKSQNIKVFKNIKQTINLPESKFSNSPNYFDISWRCSHILCSLIVLNTSW